MSKKKRTHPRINLQNLNNKKLFRYCFFGILIISIVLIVFAFITSAYHREFIKDKDTLVNNRNTGILLLDNKGDPFFSFFSGKRRKYVPLIEISKNVERAVIVSEDREFYRHNGISIRSIIRAIGLDFDQKSLAYGGSTITQQLVKNVLLTPEKSFVRKYQEAVLASQIEFKYSKEEIMEMYLNSIYFGEGSFGIEDASNTYFGKSAKDLSITESAFLVGVLPSPSRLSPYTGNVQEGIKKQRIVLKAMRDENVISEDEYKSALSTELKFKNNNTDTNNIAPHFALMVRDALIQKYGEEEITRSGFVVKTTLDTELQEFAEVIVKNQTEKLKANNVTNSASVVMDPKTGEIKSLVGSADWADEKNGKVNMAIVPRQPGSSFKPIVYAKAFEDRLITPASILNDKPTVFRDPNCQTCEYRPRNYDDKFRGNVLVRRALANSLNIPAVEIMEKVGVEKTLSKSRELGIDTLRDSSNYGLSLVLGAGEVPLIKMTEAYSAFANKGEKSEVKLITEISDKKGKIIFKATNQTKRVWPENITFLISSILSDSTARREIFGTALDVNRIAAVKTGTTDSYKDAWTIGYTPDVVVGVWVGNNDNTPMDKIAGSLGAAPIWRDLIEKYSEGKPSKDFEKPSDIIQLLICRSNGLRAKSASISATYSEYFISGTESSKECIEESKTPEKSGTESNQEKELEKMLERINNDQNGIFDEIRRRREERREKFNNR